MLESPSYRVLSRSALLLLARVEIELAHHGGKDNGRLPVTYDDFEQYGIHRHSISPAIREVEALGFLQVTERGRGGNAEFRSPNRFRLTYRHSKEVSGDGSHEWRRIDTMEQAIEIARNAREGGKRTKIPARKKQKSSDGKRRASVAETATENSMLPMAEIATAAIVQKPPRLSISRDGSRSAPTGSAVASEPSRGNAIDLIVRSHGCSRTEAAAILDTLPDAPSRSDEFDEGKKSSDAMP
jgi:hypothetical protein